MVAAAEVRPSWDRSPARLDLADLESVCLRPAQMVPEGPLRLGIGAFGPEGEALEGFHLIRNYGRSTVLDPAPAEAVIPGPVIFGGVLFGHFGHFLLESLARAWALRATPDLPIVWLPLSEAGLAPWQMAVFDLLGIDPGRHLLLRRPTRFGRLLLPDAGFQVAIYLHPEQVRALGVVPFAAPRPGRRVWLSRSALPSHRARIGGEAEVEALLAREGWEILRPEALTLPAQLAALADAETIAGFEGSAFHLLVLAREVRARILVLRRHRRPGNANFRLIARAKRLDQRILQPDLVEAAVAGTAQAYALASPAAVVAMLRKAARV